VRKAMKNRVLLVRWRLGWLLAAGAPCALLGAGSGLNVVVVVNQASSNSLALGNYYCERRLVPPQNLFRINWPGSNIAWGLDQFQGLLAAPLQTMLAERGLAGQIDCVVLSMDIPYRVINGDGINGTTSVLFYDFKPDAPPPAPDLPASCSLPPASANPYAGSELPFRESAPGTNAASFLATMITGASLAQAMSLVDQGLRSDAAFPTQTVALEKTSDVARNVRYLAFDNAIFDQRINGLFPMIRTNSDQTAGWTNLLGLDTGLATFTLSTGAFVPGAVADTLTSYGGYLFEASGQTPLLAFLDAGAAGSYGTVTEPCNYLEKFPDPLVYFYQARGFSLAEAYYQSLRNPYQGVIVAEPLAAPFARPAWGQWVGLASNVWLSGTTQLSLQFAASDTNHPLAQVDLFLDGLKFQTLTNLSATENDHLSVTLNAQTIGYTVPVGATLQSIADDLAVAINGLSDQTGIEANAMGDRLELESTNLDRAGAQTLVSVGNWAGGGPAPTTFLTAARPDFLDSVARGSRLFQVSGSATTGDFLQLAITKTNGEIVVLGVTNGGGPANTVALTQELLAMLNATPALQGPDGVSAEDTYPYGSTIMPFFLYARSPGLQAAQVQITLLASTNLLASPTNPSRLDGNLTDLRPRNHLYLTVGAPDLLLAFPLATSALADGFHELTAVAYEGSHIRTQSRVTQTVRIGNTALAATLTGSAPLGVAALTDALQWTVTANTNAIRAIELFSTGGSLGVASNTATVLFSVACSFLGEGLHPFWATVTDAYGNGYRTEKAFVRIMAAPPVPPFMVSVAANPIRLSWPAVAGHGYQVLSTDDFLNPFDLQATLSATNTGFLLWTDPQPAAAQRFYRVRATP
jgi:uncharacterized protein (TIGR03790 family)